MYRFLLRNRFSFRKTTHLGQPLPNNFSNLFIEFQKNVLMSQKNNHQYRWNPYLYRLFQNKKVDFKRGKDIDIITFGNEKVRISVLLGITDKGKKISSVLIFKAKPYGKLEKKLNQINIVKGWKFLVFWKEKSWWVTEIFINWHKLVFLNYQKKKQKPLLINIW